MNALANWLESTWVNELVLGYAWTWPTLETLHFIGLCLLIGALLIMDLRLIGFQRIIPLSAVHRLMPMAIAGFVINLVTGILFCFGDPHRYFINISFQLKMLLYVIAGLNALWYQFKLSPRIDALPDGAELPSEARIAGAMSLGLWFGVLILGRLIPYLGTG